MTSQHETPYGDAVVDTKEAAAFLGYDVCSFHASLNKWGLEATKMGGKNYYFKSDLEKIKAGRVQQKYGSGHRWVVPSDWRTA